MRGAEVMTILIMEGNTPDIVAAGDSGAASFVRTFLVIAPTARLHIVSPYAGTIEPEVFEGVDGVVFTGSGTMWSTAEVSAKPQVEAMERTFGAGLPVWGSCNGMQLAALVLGGEVLANPRGLEVGMARGLSPTTEGKSHPMMKGRSDVFAVPTVHRDVITRIPDGAVIVASNDVCDVQAMAFEEGGVDFWGTQYHPELAARDIATYVRTPGIFDDHRSLAEDLDIADIDDAAARRLGSTSSALHIEQRTLELQNWLVHLQARST